MSVPSEVAPTGSWGRLRVMFSAWAARAIEPESAAGVPRWLRGPWLPLGLLALVIVLVAPWLDAPVNDDWQYARAAKLLAKTGSLVIDTPIAPSIVVQSYLAAGLARVLGFSHVTLRMLTVALAMIGIVCIERTLHAVSAARVWTLGACALLVVNPIALHITASYLSEWYGYLFALLAVALWFRVRARQVGAQPLPGWLYLLAALLAVLAFWSRQFAVMVYPALVASRLLPVWRAGLRTRVREIASALAGTALVAGGVLGYFAWARATGNYKPAFATPVSALTTFSARIWLIQWGACLAYMSASFAPLLLLARSAARARDSRWLSVGLPLFMIAGLLALQVSGGQGYVPDRPLNARFPYVNNIVYPTGIGPVTLTDVYVQRTAQRPDWSSPNAWLYIEFAVLASTALWGVLRTRRREADEVVTEAEPVSARAELVAFAAYWLFGSTTLSIQAYQGDVFDRYYFPCLLALALLVPALLTRARVAPLRIVAQLLPAALAFAALAWFSIAGVHDYFAWNRARSELYEQAQRDGISHRVIDAGYELNGWNNLDAFLTNAPPPTGCIGACGCTPWSWYCHDNSYRIIMSPAPPGYESVASIAPPYWLAPGPPVQLVRRH